MRVRAKSLAREAKLMRSELNDWKFVFKVDVPLHLAAALAGALSYLLSLEERWLGLDVEI